MYSATSRTGRDPATCTAAACQKTGEAIVIDAERDIGYFSTLLITEFYESRNQRRRKIIDAEIPGIFKRLERVRLSRP